MSGCFPQSMLFNAVVEKKVEFARRVRRRSRSVESTFWGDSFKVGNHLWRHPEDAGRWESIPKVCASSFSSIFSACASEGYAHVAHFITSQQCKYSVYMFRGNCYLIRCYFFSGWFIFWNYTRIITYWLIKLEYPKIFYIIILLIKKLK